MSILDSIRLAEEKNEAVKQEALQFAEAHFEAAKEEIKKETEVLQRRFKEQKEQLRNETSTQLASMKKKIEEKYLVANDEIMMKANDRVSMAVDFILEKVIVV